MVLLYGEVLVFDSVSFLEELYAREQSQVSPLARDVLRAGYDTSVWQQVCESADVPLGEHRQSAYLRNIEYLPRVFFAVRPCRFCGMPEGNSVARRVVVLPIVSAVVFPCASYGRVSERSSTWDSCCPVQPSVLCASRRCSVLGSGSARISVFRFS